MTYSRIERPTRGLPPLSRASCCTHGGGNPKLGRATVTFPWGSWLEDGAPGPYTPVLSREPGGSAGSRLRDGSPEGAASPDGVPACGVDGRERPSAGPPSREGRGAAARVRGDLRGEIAPGKKAPGGAPRKSRSSPRCCHCDGAPWRRKQSPAVTFAYARFAARPASFATPWATTGERRPRSQLRSPDPYGQGRIAAPSARASPRVREESVHRYPTGSAESQPTSGVAKSG